ncbi:EamA/RhaT family transporter [Pedobacter sp. SYP-B3415]|uniref:EamA family transporter n=1 Tax=Pedobacter sp. SYP-B3415 TaxID=2496641 RepID=UPI00101D3248|nr:EamA/RhaT family transporter [Pedobacter sp. SYP-B3415]
MILFLLSIICSVTVSVLLKLAKRYHISVPQAITWNYLTAMVASWFLFKPDVTALSNPQSFDITLSLAFLLPSVFWLLGASVRNSGIVRTDIAQRLSLFISILGAFFLFDERFNSLKWMGLATGLAAICLTVYRPEKVARGNNNWIYPLLVFFGYGVIDLLFKRMALIQDRPYTTSLFVVFCASFLVSMIALIIMIVRRKTRLQLINFFCGIVLGLFNLGNIVFYLKAHRAFAGNPSTVFATMNFGVIALGTIVGIFIFRERLSKLNYAGLALAIVSIVLITLSQIYAV